MFEIIIIITIIIINDFFKQQGELNDKISSLNVASIFFVRSCVCLFVCMNSSYIYLFVISHQK